MLERTLLKTYAAHRIVIRVHELAVRWIAYSWIDAVAVAVEVATPPRRKVNTR